MSPAPNIPLWLKLGYSAFVGVLVPCYWKNYGPTNFLYFCDVALLVTLVAIWREDSLLASLPAVGILLPQALWMVDFLAECGGFRLTGMTCYMFDGGIPLFTRFLSFFHFWLPILIVWLVWRLGYDGRALAGWTALAWVLLVVCYFFMPAPPAPADNRNLPVNINYVHGLSAERQQQWLPPLVYFGVMLVVMPLAIFLPTHVALRKLFSKPVADDKVEHAVRPLIEDRLE